LRRAAGFRGRSPGRFVVRRRALATAGALLCLLAAPVPAAAQVELDVEREVRKLEIHGNFAYESGTLRDLLRTRPSSFWRPFRKHPLRSDFIRSDRQTLATFYWRHGYLQARVDSVIILPVGESSKSDVHFYLTEGPRAVVSAIQMEDLGPLSEAEFRKSLRYHVGSPLDMPIVEASRDSVIYAYADRGHVLAKVVDSLAVENNQVSVTYRVEPGPKVALDSVFVEGTQKTKPSYVSREMLLKRGDTLRRSKLIHSQQRIYDSGLYSDVQMSLEPPDSTRRADLIVTVREQKMGWIDAGIGYGTVDQIRLTAQWGQRNIFRTGMRFVATGRLGLLVEKDLAQTTFGDRRIDVALTHPWPLGVRIQTTVGAYAEEEPIIQETDEFPERANGGSVVFASPFLRDIRSYLSYELRHVYYDSASVASGTGSYNTNRIAFTNEWDTRLDIFNPTQGQDIVGKVELVTGATPQSGWFSNFGILGSKYWTFFGRTILAARVRGGFLEPWGPRTGPDSATGVPAELAEIPPGDRYRTGGASTVRGYLENEFGSREVPDTTNGVPGTRIEARGGQVLILASVELRVPLVWILSAAAFFDGGNVWERPEDIKPSKIFSFGGGAGYNDMRYSGGVGLRIGTPIGPVRFDYGWKIRSPRTPYEPDLSSRRGEFHFSLGNPF
jgi:outer membrane protein assembly complex protein YaeT